MTLVIMAFLVAALLALAFALGSADGSRQRSISRFVFAVSVGSAAGLITQEALKAVLT